jgi:FkbM family methyltransferase
MCFPREEAADALRMAAGTYEPTVVYLIKRLVKEGDIAVDLGASYGYYTMLLASLVGRDGKVFAFEPEPISYTHLLRNIKELKNRTVITVKKAVANKKGSAMLLVPKTGHRAGSHLMFGAENGIPVNVITLDEYFKDKNRAIYSIKMDIEGSEIAAL